jgi:crotonobetainyl-CoA:carnitine CoA-transferase CaiB-like acyl-CoA transferase
MIAPYGAYPVGIGGRIVIAIQNEREWARFCDQVLGDAALAEDSRFCSNALRVANRGEMDALIAAVFAPHDAESLSALLFEAGIAFGRLNEVADLASHAQLRRLTVASPTGPVEIIAPPAQFASDSGGLGPVPALGEHTDAVRAEFADAG